MTSNPKQNLAPLWPEMPAFCPQKPRPAYRFVAHETPHPHRDPGGHSYGEYEPQPPVLPPEAWPENQPYLYGIDLYHEGYLWEAHEVWESLWKPLGRDSIQGLYYQALIQNTAAQLKRHMRSSRGTRKLSLYALHRLEAVLGTLEQEGQTRYMGIDLPDFLDQMKRHYGPLWRDPERSVDDCGGRAPKLNPA